MRRLLALTVLLVLATPAVAATTRTVTIKNIAFSKPTVRIAKGDTVRWLFRDSPSSHNVTSRGTRRFRSSASKLTGSYSVRFTKSGTYRYVCTIHPNMTGKVVVG